MPGLRCGSRAVLLGWAAFGVYGGLLGRGAVRGQASPLAADCENGYRRAGLLRDFALGRGWTVYADCAHPERPRVAVSSGAGRPLVASAPIASIARPGPVVPDHVPRPGGSGDVGLAGAGAARPLVESGSGVRAWRRDGVAAVDLAAMALGSGGAGARIRVRVSPGGAVLRGTVRGAGSVELDAPGAGGFLGEGK